MTSNSSILRSITNIDLKQVVRKAIHEGFVVGDMNGTRVQLIWPPTGEKVGISTTGVADRNAYKNVGRQLEQVSGLTLLSEHKHGKPAHEKGHEAFITTHPGKQDQWSVRVQDILAEYRVLALEFRIITMAEADYKDISRAFQIIRRMAALESVLTELHQPIPEHGLALPSELAKEFENA